ncbi:MAG: SGNH/GDSL hydrolase family protein [Planctomycetota bacterium]|jgi:lysophospholipase L1-like esterase
MTSADQSVRISPARKVAFTGLLVLGALMLVEIGLRIAGVSFYPTAITLTDRQNKKIDEVKLEADAELQWVIAPGSPPESPLAINEFRMRGGPITLEKPSETLRILCLGDSCTFGARSERPYPALLSDMIQEELSIKVEVLNAAVPGYAAHQGLGMLERCLKFSPDIVTVYYGWNDHWLRSHALARHKLEKPPWTDHVLLLRGLRMAYRRYQSRARVADEEKRISMTNSALTLPPLHYGAMLDEIAVVAGRNDIDVVYLTAPAALNQANLDWIVADRGWANSTDDVVALHDRYNEISREMAAKWNAPLVDLAARLDTRSVPLMHWDGIHLTEKGHQQVAETIFKIIKPLLLARSQQGSEEPITD